MLRKPSRQFSNAPPSTLAHIVPPSLLDSPLPLPRLIVFDIDYTLWPFWVDTHVTPPVKANAAHSAATDRYGEDYAFYSDVPSVLQALPQLPCNPASATTPTSPRGGNSNSAPANVKLGVASRTSAPSLAREMLKMLHLQPLASLAPSNTGSTATGSGKEEKPRRAFDVFEGGLEIYPGSKIRHFEALHKRTGIPYNEMLFFDDESRNRDTESLGVTMWLVRDGVTWVEVEKGVAEWRKRRGHR